MAYHKIVKFVSIDQPKHTLVMTDSFYRFRQWCVEHKYSVNDYVDGKVRYISRAEDLRGFHPDNAVLIVDRYPISMGGWVDDAIQYFGVTKGER